MIKLSKIPTKASKGTSKDDIKIKTTKLVQEIGHLQHALYAESKQALLVVFQGMDASGKDGATKNVFSKCGTIGTDAYGFKRPTSEEFAHDFLWRVHKLSPAKGFIQIFNRSHYEDILIQRVHNWIDNKQVKVRMDAINAYETLLEKDNNTKVLKFYMHISKERQREKLQKRIDDPKKNWKHKTGDWEETKLWLEYRKAYEYAINNSIIPWTIVPVDQRWYRDFTIATIIRDTLKNMNPQLPLLTEEDKQAVIKIQETIKT
ncbi:MAG: PPK2 family polyphosphate kinase [Saprospiraceae bacterium]